MLKRTSIGSLATLVAIVALAAHPGCSKDKKKDAAKKPIPAKSAKMGAQTGGNTATAAPAAATKLLALKFHHDD